MIATYEASWSGFWLARWLATHRVEVHVVQPSSVLVDRRARRAKSDGIDAELLLRTLLAWLRGEPRVCSMVPIPDEGDEDVAPLVRERAELLTERVAWSIVSVLCWRPWAALTTTRCCETGGSRLDELCTAFGTSLPPHALPRSLRMLDRLELICAQIAELERERDAVLEEKTPNKADEMIQQLAKLRGIGVQSATVLVREAFVREFANGKALGSYAGLCATPYSSGVRNVSRASDKAGNRRLRTVMIELAWLWQRYQTGSAEVAGFVIALAARERVCAKSWLSLWHGDY